jgi:hypothetical protein
MIEFKWMNNDNRKSGAPGGIRTRGLLKVEKNAWFISLTKEAI